MCVWFTLGKFWKIQKALQVLNFFFLLFFGEWRSNCWCNLSDYKVPLGSKVNMHLQPRMFVKPEAAPPPDKPVEQTRQDWQLEWPIEIQNTANLLFNFCADAVLFCRSGMNWMWLSSTQIWSESSNLSHAKLYLSKLFAVISGAMYNGCFDFEPSRSWNSSLMTSNPVFPIPEFLSYWVNFDRFTSGSEDSFSMFIEGLENVASLSEEIRYSRQLRSAKFHMLPNIDVFEAVNGLSAASIDILMSEARNMPLLITANWRKLTEWVW